LQNSEEYKVHRRHKFSQTFLIFYSELNKFKRFIRFIIFIQKIHNKFNKFIKSLVEKQGEPVSVTLFPLGDPNVILMRNVAFKSF
jgi:hypothetical protein